MNNPPTHVLDMERVAIADYIDDLIGHRSELNHADDLLTTCARLAAIAREASNLAAYLTEAIRDRLAPEETCPPSKTGIAPT